MDLLVTGVINCIFNLIFYQVVCVSTQYLDSYHIPETIKEKLVSVSVSS